MTFASSLPSPHLEPLQRSLATQQHAHLLCDCPTNPANCFSRAVRPRPLLISPHPPGLTRRFYSVLSRAYRPTITLLKPTSHPEGGAASPVSDHSATAKQHPNTTGTTKGNTTSPTASASQYNSPKSESQDLKEAEEAAAGPEAADAQYGGGNIVEGN